MLVVPFYGLRQTLAFLRPAGTEPYASFTMEIPYVRVQKEKREIPSSDASKMVKSVAVTSADQTPVVELSAEVPFVIACPDLKETHPPFHA